MSVSQSSGQPMCSVPRPRWLWVATGTASKMRSISPSEKPSSTSRSRERPSTSFCAHGHAVMPWARDADEPARAGLAGHGDAEQRVDLLREDAGHGRRLVLRVAGLDVDLGAARALAVADLLGDVLGERLGAQRGLAEHHLADRVVDDLLEARHVRALLLRAEIDEAVEPRGVQLLGAVGLDPDDLLDVRHAHARERDGERRGLRLDVLECDFRHRSSKASTTDSRCLGVACGKRSPNRTDRCRIACYKAGTERRRMAFVPRPISRPASRPAARLHSKT